MIRSNRSGDSRQAKGQAVANVQTKTESKTVATVDTKPRRLGRGLSALLGEPVAVNLPPIVSTPAAPSAPAAARVSAAASEPAGAAGGREEAMSARVVRVAVEAVTPSPFQPRKTFDEGALKELAASIASAGVVQPILVRPSKSGGYELIAGERRWRASKIAGLSHVPAVVSTLSDEQAAEWSLIENLQRADLSAMERATAVRNLCEKFGLSHAQAAERLGMDRSSVTNLVRLTDLEPEVRELLESGGLSIGHGKALLAAPPGASRVKLAQMAAQMGWSVRRVEEMLVRSAKDVLEGSGGNMVRASEKALSKAAAVRDLEKQLGEHLGTNVRVRANAGGTRGSLVIRFYDLDHFDGLMQKIGFRLR